jgi:hypothetical protein
MMSWFLYHVIKLNVRGPYSIDHIDIHSKINAVSHATILWVLFIYYILNILYLPPKTLKRKPIVWKDLSWKGFSSVLNASQMVLPKLRIYSRAELDLVMVANVDLLEVFNCFFKHYFLFLRFQVKWSNIVCQSFGLDNLIVTALVKIFLENFP